MFYLSKQCCNCESASRRGVVTSVKDGKKLCRKCNKIKPVEEFSPGKNGPHSFCRVCVRKANRKLNRQFKDLCLEYKGGKCITCGYNKSPAALEFHHRDPTQKDFAISCYTKRKDFNIIKTELDKCDLLCANCHKELHRVLVDKEQV